MNQTSNITNSCYGFASTFPEAWRTRVVTDPFYNTSGCAVPACGSNAEILARCSNTTVDNLSLFNTTRNQTYLSYILSSTDSGLNHALQNCLLDNNAVRYLCAVPPYPVASCGGGNSITTQQTAIPGNDIKYQACTTPNNVNNTKIMRSCCDKVESDLGGCQVSCWKEYTNGSTLSDCLSDTSRRQDISMSFLCTPSSQSLKNGDRNGNPNAGHHLLSHSNSFQMIAIGVFLATVFLQIWVRRGLVRLQPHWKYTLVSESGRLVRHRM